MTTQNIYDKFRASTIPAFFRQDAQDLEDAAARRARAVQPAAQPAAQLAAQLAAQPAAQRAAIPAKTELTAPFQSDPQLFSNLL